MSSPFTYVLTCAESTTRQVGAPGQCARSVRKVSAPGRRARSARQASAPGQFAKSARHVSAPGQILAVLLGDACARRTDVYHE
eukprot:1195424-Prorocentrum_minimum.AAC.10